jgi:exodeoxyribonuclease V beta subunit
LEAYGSFGSAQFFKYVGFGAEKVSMQAGGEAQEDAVDGKDECSWTYFKPNAPEFGFKLRPAGTGTHSSPSGGDSMASESAPSGGDSMASEAAASDTAVPPTAAESVVLEVSIESDLSDWAPEAPAIELPDLNWRKLSYSSLSKKTESPWRTKRESAAAHTDYDRFIFQHLRSGTQTGIMLHELFERIDFQSSEHWQRHIQQALKRYPTGVRTPDGDGHLRIQEMLHILTRTALGANGPVLQDVPRNRRLNEASFHLPLRKMDCAGLLNWADQRSIGLNIPESGSLEGLLNGVVDLFFEHKGRYYILDWKSDRLGDTVDDYDLPLLEQAMAERNYTLQYYLYTLALYRYLKHRITGFDYERHFGGVFYVFLRGVREGSDRGIYHRKPPLGDVLALEERMLAHA